jgi:hypothetical protein
MALALRISFAASRGHDLVFSNFETCLTWRIEYLKRLLNLVYLNPESFPYLGYPNPESLLNLEYLNPERFLNPESLSPEASLTLS